MSQIIEPYARMMNCATPQDGLILLRLIEWCGRVSHRSEEAQSNDSWEKFIRAVVLGHGDWSIVEHASVSVDVVVDRGITHEWVRHRLGAYTQESTRFINYDRKMVPAFIQPPGLTPDQVHHWMELIQTSESTYRTLIQSGCTPQIARSVFPTGLASRLIVTYNLRNWRHFFLMRTTREAHPQIRQVTIPLLAEFQSKIPLLFDDIVPNVSQSTNVRLPR